MIERSQRIRHGSRRLWIRWGGGVLESADEVDDVQALSYPILSYPILSYPSLA